MTITVDTEEAQVLVKEAIQAGLVTMLTSSPGIGKSAIVKEVADYFNLELIDIRLSQCEPTDLMGFPHVVDGRGTYAPMDMWPIEGTPLPEGKDGWLVFLDEMNSGAMATQAAAYKVLLDKIVGMAPLHKRVALVAAGNKESDGAIVNRLSTATQSRILHLELKASSKTFIEHAHKQGFDHRVISFIEFKPDSLHKFDPNHSDKTYPCPRTWEFVSKLIRKHDQDVPRYMLPLLAGTVGEGMAREFFAFTKVFRELPKIQEIVNNPLGIPVPDEPSVLYALTGSIAEHAKESNIESLMKFVNRLPAEFQYMTLRSAATRNPEIMENDALRKWITEAALKHF